MSSPKDSSASPRSSGSLTVVGTGHLLAGHVTTETMAHIQGADKVFMLADGITEGWIATLNPTAESLRDSYDEGKSRLITYREMVVRLLTPLRAGARVCAVFYGHPGVFVMPSREAIQQARSEQLRAMMLPAVSAEDSLFADLGIDPVRNGCQSFEATDFLIRNRRFDPTCGLVLWQIGAIAVTTHKSSKVWNRSGLEALVERLLDSYPATHEVVVYSASGLPTCDPLIERLALSELSQLEVTTAATLWVQPKETSPLDEQMVARLGLTWPPENPSTGLKPRVLDASAPRGRLTIVGTGYKVAGQVGPQAKRTIETVDQLFYLVTEPATAHWLTSLNPTAKSLADCYQEGESGGAAAREMIAQILQSVREGLHVGVAFSGHPAIGLWVPHAAIRLARDEGHAAKMFPAVSFEDCLIADLGADPAFGRVMADATDFLIRPRIVDPASALVLIQAGVVGESRYRTNTAAMPERLQLLAEVLARHYPAEHPVTLYDIAVLPPFEPKVRTVPLAQLPKAELTVATTLYLPPKEEPVTDPMMLERLGLCSPTPS